MKPNESKRKSFASIPVAVAYGSPGESMAPPSSAGPEGRIRRGGNRRELSERVLIKSGNASLDGWAINISRGGIRVLVEGHLELGADISLTVGVEGPVLQQRGRVVWTQEEEDGTIAGVAFMERGA